MSKLKEITGYNRNNKQLMKYVNLHQLSLPPLDQLYEIALVDHNGRPYVFRLLKPEPATDTLDDFACESLSIDLSDIKEVFMKLTDDQRNIVMHVYYLYKKRNEQNSFDDLSEENPKIILQGPAGSGKSTIISFIEKLITWEENKTSDSPNNLKVIKCAFTGKAASNIDGLTLNHTFSIPIYKTRNLSKKRLETKKEALKDCVFFICDEISMVGQRTMSVVNSRLQQIFDNDKLYGNRFVLLVGDLYQIDPVRQKPVYPKSKFWTCCEFYELTKIIRQKDKRFTRALNNFRDSKMSPVDMHLLRSREVEDYDQVPDDVIHIFYENKRVDEYNNIKLNKTNEKEEVVNAIEDCDNWDPSRLRLKIGIRYMITYNIDVGDGLANGTTGIVKDFDYDKHGGVSAVWMEFHSNVIGRKTRLEYLNKLNKTGIENWVPIPRSKIVVKLKSDPKVNKTIGNMFPLKAAEAITVHKSQGQTYHDGVCIHITKDPYDKLRTDKSLQYVALTRVTQLTDLYIMGSIDFSNINSDKFCRTERELNRLRNEKKLQLAYETFEDKPGDVIIYLNTGGTFYEHHQFISADKWYENASLLILLETNTISSDQIDMPNLEVAFRSEDETALRLGGGIICYKERSKSVDVISLMLDEENQTYLMLLLFESMLYIVTGVKGDLNEDDFTSAIKKFVSRYIKDKKCIFFIGNFNYNSRCPTLKKFFKDFDINKDFSCDILTSSGEIQSDVVFTRNFDIHKDHIGHYQYIPSSNKPIYVKLPPKTELLESLGEFIDSSESQSVSGKSISDDESQLTNRESQSEISASQSNETVNSDVQSVNRGAQSYFESLCMDSEPLTDDGLYESVNKKSKHMKSESQYTTSDSQSTNSENNSANGESQSVYSETRSANESETENSDSQSVESENPSVTSVARYNSEDQCMDSEPDYSQSLLDSMEMD